MVLAQETARTAQAIQSSLEAQVRALTQERDTLRAEALGGRKEADALRAEVERRERHHDKELLKVREAFVQYDANVAEYLEEVRLDHAEDLQRARKEAREELLASRAGSAALPRQLNEYPADRAPATPQQQQQQPRSTHNDPGARSGEDGVPADVLRSALMRHLNSYANARFQLPVQHPIPHGVHAAEHILSPPAALPPTMAGHSSRNNIPRDRSVL
jgi:hypothetical protein